MRNQFKIPRIENPELHEAFSDSNTLFNFTYPYPSTGKDIRLESLIYDHFKYYQLFTDDVDRFQHKLKSVMRENMGYYNSLYESTRLTYNPIKDFDYSESRNRHLTSESGDVETYGREGTLNEDIEISNEGKNVTSSSQSSFGKDKGTSTNRNEDATNVHNLKIVADTPQGTVDNIEHYMSSAVKEDNLIAVQGLTTVNNSSEVNGVSTASESEDIDTTMTEGKDRAYSEDVERTIVKDRTDNETYNINISGKKGYKSYAQLIEEHRRALLNVDLLVIKLLNPLFIIGD